MSLRALADRVDFSASFLSQIENGQCSPSISSMEKIANALGVTLGQFFLSANQQVNIVRASDRCPHGPGLVAGRNSIARSAFQCIAIPRIHAHHQAQRPHGKPCHAFHL